MSPADYTPRKLGLNPRQLTQLNVVQRSSVHMIESRPYTDLAAQDLKDLKNLASCKSEKSMIEVPHLERTKAHDIAVIHLTVPRNKIRDVMGPGLAELRAAVAAQGLAANGPWFTHHLRMQPETFDFEIGVPVTGPVSPTANTGELHAGCGGCPNNLPREL